MFTKQGEIGGEILRESNADRQVVVSMWARVRN